MLLNGEVHGVQTGEMGGGYIEIRFRNFVVPPEWEKVVVSATDVCASLILSHLGKNSDG